MISEMREKLSREVDQLSHELNILLPQAIAQAVDLGDLRENSEYKAALERQQFVQARLGQLHQRLNQLSQLANTEAPTDRVGLGSRVTVLDLETNETDIYMVVLAEMMDIDAGHISLASPLGRALAAEGGRRDQSAPAHREPKLRITELVTVHQAESADGKREAQLQAMEFPKKQLLVVGDRVLITPEEGDERTRVGLYLPPTAMDTQQVQTGLIVATGPVIRWPTSAVSTTSRGRSDGRSGGRGMQAQSGRPRDLLPQGRRRDHVRGQ